MASIAYNPHTPIPPLAASDSLLLIPSRCLNLFRWKPPLRSWKRSAPMIQLR